MATIPIEITIQDQASPITPTPSTNTETNITVPDTGAGTLGNNTFSSSSVASIIVPAVLLALALATVCTLLIHKHRKHQNSDKLSKKEKLATAASGTIAILAATVLVGNLVIPATKAATSVEPGTADLDVVDKITITATREINSDIVVATVKNTSYATANLDFGYKVTASIIKGAATANLYLDGNTDSPYYIAPVTGGTLTDNTWGYTLSEEAEEYLAIPLADAPTIITKGNDIVENEAVDIYYTIKADKSLPAGTYTGELEYTIAPAVEYMQDFATMTEEEKTATLANMSEGEQYTLKDIRDKKPYYISRLADGNVWMTQNLDLDLNENTTLTSADTDVSESWKPLRSTINFTGTTVDGWQNDNNTPYSANPGDVYYYTSGNNENDKRYDLLADCEREHPDGTCSHYHVGNYYNWSAAVASNDTSNMTEQYYNAPDSICPAGWKISTGKQSGDDPLSNNDLGILLSRYSILGGEGCGGSCYEYANGGFSILRAMPLYLVRFGSINNTSFDSNGNNGYYWSSTVNNSWAAYSLYFNRSEIYPTIYHNYGNRGSGYSVRCLAR